MEHMTARCVARNVAFLTLRQHCAVWWQPMRLGVTLNPVSADTDVSGFEYVHVVVIDGVFEPDPEQGVRFIAAKAIAAEAVRVVQTQVRRRILRAFVRRGRIDAQTRKEMEAWDHGGGFSLDASVRIEADDRKGLERLLRYCARPPFAGDRLEELDPQRLRSARRSSRRQVGTTSQNTYAPQRRWPRTWRPALKKRMAMPHLLPRLWLI